MNKYEIMFILKSNDVEAINTQVSELKAIITDMKGEIVNVEDNTSYFEFTIRVFKKPSSITIMTVTIALK